MTTFSKGVFFITISTLYMLFGVYLNFEIKDFNKIKEILPTIISLVGVLLAVFVALIGYAAYYIEGSNNKKEACDNIENSFYFNLCFMFTFLLILLNFYIIINTFNITEKEMKFCFYTTIIIANFSVYLIYITLIDLINGVFRRIKFIKV